MGDTPTEEAFLVMWRGGELTVNCGGPDVCGGCEAEEAQKVAQAPTNCRSGCKTQDHGSYAECLRAANFQIGNLK